MKCGHEPCTCQVEPGGYCSEQCALAVEPDLPIMSMVSVPGLETEPAPVCGCGHPECLAMHV